MSMHLFSSAKAFDGEQSSSSQNTSELRILCAYENGSVVLRRFAGEKKTSVEGIGWEVIWTVKLHVEASEPI